MLSLYRDRFIADGSSPQQRGTKSTPPSANGWQRAKRLTAKRSPFAQPCMTSACLAYSEQVGWYRHLGRVKGLIATW